MATGFPVKANYATGDVLTAANMNDLSGTVNYLQYMPPRNSILNSNFSIWQRGTSFTGSNTYAYTADRWAWRDASGGSGSIGQVTTSLPTGFRYGLKLGRAAAATTTSAQIISQPFETNNSIPFAGQTITFSFYAKKGANFSPTSLAFGVYSGTGTDQAVIGTTGGIFSWTGSAAVIDTSLTAATLTTSWVRYTYTGTVSASATQLGLYFQYVGVGTAGADDYIYITGVQLELGSSANTYMPNQPTYQGELAACQRYYVRANGEVNGGPLGPVGQNISTTQSQVTWALPVTMRTTPSYAFSSPLSTASVLDITGARKSLTATANNGTNTKFLSLTTTVASGLLAGYATFVCDFNLGSSYLEVSAEL